MFDKMLIEYCSPTLGGIKTANLFTYYFETDGELQLQLQAWNTELNPKGIVLSVLKITGNRALVYVYRPAMLEKRLHTQEVHKFLFAHGYDTFSIPYCLKKLEESLAYTDFPHEIGIFLGYPLEDVKGFINNFGQNCKCIGYWKVYGNEHEAIKTFERFKKCKEIYKKLFESRSKSIYQLTVAVS